MSVSPTACPRCLARGKTWRGDDPRCAFPLVDGRRVFTIDNWGCASMSLLRGALLCTPAAVAESEGQSLATVPDPSHEKDGLFLLVGWYKRRGATDLCRVVGDHDTWPASLADVERAIVWAQGPGLLAADDLHRMAAIGEAMVREIATPGAVDLVLKHATPAEAVGWLVDTLRDRGL